MPARKEPKTLDYGSPVLKAPPDIKSRVSWVVCAYLLLMPLGAIALRVASSSRSGNELTMDRARFAAVNALTLTGFQASIAAGSFTLAGQIVILILTLIGALFAMVVGGMAVVRILRLKYSDRQVSQSAVLSLGVLVLVGMLPLIEAGHTPLEAMMLAASAFANSGVFLGALPGAVNWQTHVVILPLAVLGGLGLPVLMEMWDAMRGRGGLSFHSRTVLKLTAYVYLATFFLFLAMQTLRLDRMPDRRDVARLLATSSAASLNSRTAGFSFAGAQALDFPRAMQWVLAICMIAGGNPGGCAGGVKWTTFVELFRGVRKLLRGQNAGRGLGIAITWVGGYAGIVIICFLMLLWAQPQLPGDRLLFESISAVSNVGMSHDLIMTVGPGLDVLCIGMILGRLAPLGILWWMAESTEPAELAFG